MDRRLWDLGDTSARLHFRGRNTIGRAVLLRVDDSGPVQLHQIEGYPTEVQDNVQFPGVPGFGMVPLPGAKLVTVHQGGYRGSGAVVAVVDPRYRASQGNPGETVVYMVDGANAATGAGGTMWKILQGLMGGVCKLFGKTMVIGDSTNTTTIAVYGKTSVTIHSPSVVATNGGTPSPVVTLAGPSTVLRADA